MPLGDFALDVVPGSRNLVNQDMYGKPYLSLVDLTWALTRLTFGSHSVTFRSRCAGPMRDRRGDSAPVIFGLDPSVPPWLHEHRELRTSDCRPAWKADDTGVGFSPGVLYLRQVPGLARDLDPRESARTVPYPLKRLLEH